MIPIIGAAHRAAAAPRPAGPRRPGPGPAPEPVPFRTPQIDRVPERIRRVGVAGNVVDSHVLRSIYTGHAQRASPPRAGGGRPVPRRSACRSPPPPRARPGPRGESRAATAGVTAPRRRMRRAGVRASPAERVTVAFAGAAAATVPVTVVTGPPSSSTTTVTGGCVISPPRIEVHNGSASDPA